MIVYADTSGLFSFMVRDDYMHVRAKRNFEYFMANQVRLFTSSYVLVETIALLHRRVGLGAVADFQMKLQPLLEVVWVDAEWHKRAMQRLLAQAGKDISLVDYVSFELMEARDVRVVYGFDSHFADNGFEIAAFQDLDHKAGE